MALGDIGFYKYLEAAFRFRLFNPQGKKATLSTYFKYLSYNLPYKRIFDYARRLLPPFYRTSFPNTEEGNLQMAKIVLERLDRHADPQLERYFNAAAAPKEFRESEAVPAEAVPVGASAGGEVPSTMAGGTHGSSIISPPITPNIPISSETEAYQVPKVEAPLEEADKVRAVKEAENIFKETKLAGAAKSETQPGTSPVPQIFTKSFESASAGEKPIIEKPPPARTETAPQKVERPSFRRPSLPVPKIPSALTGGAKSFASKAGTVFKTNFGKFLTVGNVGTVFSAVAGAFTGLGLTGGSAFGAITGGIGGVGIKSWIAGGGGGPFFAKIGNGFANFVSGLSDQTVRKSFMPKVPGGKRWLLLFFGGFMLLTFGVGFTGAPGPGGPGGPSPSLGTSPQPTALPIAGCEAAYVTPQILAENSCPSLTPSDECTAGGALTTCGPTAGAMMLQSAGISTSIKEVATDWRRGSPLAWDPSGYRGSQEIANNINANPKYQGRIRAIGTSVNSADAVKSLIQQTHNAVIVSAYYDNAARARGLDKQPPLSPGGISLSSGIGHMVAIYKVCTDRVYLNDPVLGEQYSIPVNQFNTAITASGSGPARGAAVAVESLNRPAPQNPTFSCPVQGGTVGSIMCGSYGLPYSGTNNGFGGICAPATSGSEQGFGGHCSPIYRGATSFCTNYKQGDNLIRTAKSIDIAPSGGITDIKLPQIDNQNIQWFYKGVRDAGCIPSCGSIRVFQSAPTSQGVWTIHFVHVRNDTPSLVANQAYNSGEIVAKMYPMSGQHVHVSVGLNIAEPWDGGSPNPPGLQPYDSGWKFVDRDLGMCIR